MGTLWLMRSWQPEKIIKAGQFAYAAGALLAMLPVFVLISQASLGGPYSPWAILLVFSVLALVGQFHFRFKRTQRPMRNMLFQQLPTEANDEARTQRNRSYLIDSIILGTLTALAVSFGLWILSDGSSLENLGRFGITFGLVFLAATVGTYLMGLLVGEGMVLERLAEEETDRAQKWALRAHAAQLQDAMVLEQEREARLAAREAALAERERALEEQEEANRQTN